MERIYPFYLVCLMRVEKGEIDEIFYEHQIPFRKIRIDSSRRICRQEISRSESLSDSDWERCRLKIPGFIEVNATFENNQGKRFPGLVPELTEDEPAVMSSDA